MKNRYDSFYENYRTWPCWSYRGYGKALSIRAIFLWYSIHYVKCHFEFRNFDVIKSRLEFRHFDGYVECTSHLHPTSRFGRYDLVMHYVHCK